MEYHEISFDTVCRNCLSTLEIRSVYSLMCDSENDINRYKEMTEYDLMILIEKWRDRDGHKCEFCNSSNVMVYNLKVDDYEIYNVNRNIQKCEESNFLMLQFRFQKNGNGIELIPSGSPEINGLIFRYCSNEIYKFLLNSSGKYFKYNSLDVGGTHIEMMIKNDVKNSEIETKIEVFRSTGMSKEQVLVNLSDYLKQFRVFVPF